MLCDLLSETYVMDKLDEIGRKYVAPEHQSEIIEATRLWHRTLEWHRAL